VVVGCRFLLCMSWCNLQDNATVVCRQVRSYKVRRNASNKCCCLISNKKVP
jgi:hypothetical protein